MFQKIIVRLPNWIGDFVMATPVLHDLRCHFPESKITALATAPIADLLKYDPSIDGTLCVQRNQSWDMAKKLRTAHFDLGILLTNSFSSAWMFWLGRVKRRVGYAMDGRSFLLTDPIEPQKVKIHQVEFYQRSMQPFGISMSATSPRLFLCKDDEESAMQLLNRRGYRAGRPLIGINPGAAYGSAKCWPVENFRLLALQLLQQCDCFVLFFGDEKNTAIAAEICRDLPERAINLAGATSVRELACLIKQCDLLVTNDSGPMHIAAALQTPMVALFGSTDDAITGPWGQKEAVIHKHPSCSPCFQRICPTDFRCMKMIQVEEVMQKAMERRKQRVSND